MMLPNTSFDLLKYTISVHEKVNQGSSFPVAIALNAGARRAAGDFIALTSGDVLWTSNTLKSFILPVTTGIKDNDALDQTLIFIPLKKRSMEICESRTREWKK